MTENTVQVVQQVDPRALLVDLNIRQDAHVSADFVDSIREQGVLQPIVAVRTPEGALRVRYGHRRTAAAVLADLASVPVVVAADDATDAAAQVERLVGQYAENEHRAGLSTLERVKAMAQLSAFGVPAAQIAHRTKVRRVDVDAALSVSRSHLASAATARYDFLDLIQAATVAEFEDEPAVVKALVSAASTGQFDHVVQRLRDQRAEAQRREAVADTLRAAGVQVVQRPEPGTPGTQLDSLVDTDGAVLTPETHTGCPGHAAFVSTVWGYLSPDDGPDVEDGVDDLDDDVEDGPAAEETPQWARQLAPVYVCTDPTSHGHQPRYRSHDTGAARPKMADLDPEQAEAARAARRDVIDSNKAWVSAETVRRTWLRTFCARKTVPKGSAGFLARALACDAEVASSIGGNHLAADLLGCKNAGYGRSTEVATLVAKAGEPRAAALSLSLVLAGYEDALTRDSWRHVTASTARYLRFLAANGYTLAGIERRACGDAPLPRGE